MEWIDNENVLRNVTTKAIEMGFGAGATPKAQGQPSQQNQNRDTKKRSRDPANEDENSRSKRSKNSSSSSSTASASNGPIVNNLELSKAQLFQKVAWESRHYANTTVETLRAANRGLAEALAQVIAQRDGLLDILRKKT